MGQIVYQDQKSISLEQFVQDVKDGKYSDYAPTVVSAEFSRLEIHDMPSPYPNELQSNLILYGIY